METDAITGQAVLDCRRVRRFWAVDAQSDDMAIGVDFPDGTSTTVSVGTPGTTGFCRGAQQP